MLSKSGKNSTAKLLCSFVLSSLAAGSAHAADLTVTAFGGAWEKAYRQCFVTPFEKSTGKTVEVLLGNPTQWLNQITARPASPPIDVLITSVDAGILAKERGVVEPITAANVPNFAEIRPKLAAFGDGYGFPLTYGDFGIMYNTKTVKNPPKTWKEFVDGVVAGKWRAAIPGISYTGTTQGLIALFGIVFGGSQDNVQAALDQVKRLRDSNNVEFYSDLNTPLIAIKSGDVDIAMYFDGRAWAEHDAGAQMIAYLNPAPGAVAWPNLAQKVKNGSPLGWKFLNVLASSEGQSCFSNAMQYAAANKNVKYDSKVEPRVATENNSLWISFPDVAKNSDKWIAMWNKQIGR